MKRIRSLIGVLLVLVMLGSIVSPVSAWGGPTHYSIVKKVDDKSGLPWQVYQYKTDYINGAVVPDIFVGIDGVTVPSGWSKLAQLMHYNLLFNSIVWQKASTDQEIAYVAGWLTHPISDYYIHGGKPSWIKPSYPHNKPYLEYKGIDPNDLPQHLLVEYNVDCITYYEKGGAAPWPWEFKVYSSFIKSCIQEYKNKYGGDFPIPTEDQINKEFTDLMAEIVAEQASFSWDKYLAAKAAFGDYEEWWKAAVDGSYNYLIHMDVVYSCASKMSVNGVQVKNKDTNVKINEEIAKIRKEIGRELIKEGILIPHGKFDKRTGIYTVWFESKVSKDKLGKLYASKFAEKIEKLKANKKDKLS